MPTLATKQAMYSQNTGEAMFGLLDVSHVELPGGVLRLTDNLEPIVSGGNTYTPAPFAFKLPKVGANERPRLNLIIFDYTRVVTETLETLDPPEITSVLKLIRGSAPDTIERVYPSLRWSQVSYDSGPLLTVELEMLYDLGGVYPVMRFDTTNFPGLF